MLADDGRPVQTGTASANQLAKLFRVNKNDIGRYLEGVTPVKREKGVAIYNIREAAGALVEPGYEIEERIRRMNKADLPGPLTTEFWGGQRGRLKYELENGNLWPTDDVFAVLSATFAEIVMAQKLMVDRVEKQTALTTRQREIIKDLADATVNASRERLFAAFEGWPVPTDNIAEEVL